MTTRDQNDQLEVEYIQLQYELADALQESKETTSPYARVAQARYGRIRSASQIALRRLSDLMKQEGVRAAPAQ